jgi:hypothetical protein
MPRSLRLALLNQYFQAGLIPADKFLRMQPFAWMEDVGNGDEDDRARANRIADMIRRGVPGPELPPALPMDNADVHMDVLRREILLDDDLPNEVRAVAFDRFMLYQQMAAQAQMAMQMQQQAATMPTQGGQKPKGKQPDPIFGPQDQPLASSRPPVAASPLSLDLSEEMSAGQGADAMMTI